MRSTRKRPRAGFTLIETLIVIFLFTVVMAAVLQLYLNFNKTYLLQNASINNSYSAGSIVNEFQHLGLQADAVIASRTFSGNTYTTGASTLILELPSINSSGDVVSGTHDYAVLYLASSSAYRILEASASSARVSGSKLLSNAVNALTFTYGNATPSLSTRVSIDIQTQSVVKQQTLQTHLIQQVYLRNI